jgi:hypothetical protein
MNKKMAFFLPILAFLLVSCGKAAPAPTITAEAVAATFTVPAATATNPRVETTRPLSTKTAKPSSTPQPTYTVIPLANWPTRTPQSPAVCPTSDAKLRIPLAGVFKNKKAAYHDARQAVLDFLNAGGEPQTAIQKLAENGVTASQMDITNDGVPEFILPSGYLTIFGCSQGQYLTLLDISPTEYTEMGAIPLVIQDLNNNGVLELFIGQAQYSDEATYRIFEWDGTKLANITPLKYQGKNTKIYIDKQVIHTIGQSNAQKGALVGNFEIVDTDGNGLKDIVLRAGVYENYLSSSTLEDQMVLKWDGKAYSVGAVTKESTPTPEPTLTPLPFSAMCAYKVSGLRYQKPTDNGLIVPSILKYLNQGGEPEQFKAYFNATIKDLNNDTAPEIVLIDQHAFEPYILMFTCKDGKYVEAVEFPDELGTFQMSLLAVADNNKNGFPEVFVKNIGCFFLRCGNLYVVEWDGEKFSQILKDSSYGQTLNYADMSNPRDAYLKDLDSNGIKELIWVGEKPDANTDPSGLPWRLATHIYKWDGEFYTAQPVEYSAPEYRFQAVQDGDRSALAGKYDQALAFYKQAIKSEGLEWWTKARQDFLYAQRGMGECAGSKTPCPPPTPDPNERPLLGAYSSFRILLVHILMNNPDEAAVDYGAMLTAYPQDNPGHPFVEMATAFWDEYKASQNMAQACSKAIDYANSHRSILTILGSGYHGWQSIDYKPEDVCPFK